jgi:iron(III) transport system substrate-binding protein
VRTYPRSRPARRRLVAAAAVTALLLAACAGDDASTGDTDAPDSDTDATAGDGDVADDEPGGPITVYSGRSEELVGQVFDDFTADTGIEVQVRYGDTAELAATILEEGDASPADLYFAQDAGALGALEQNDRFTPLPDDVLDLVDESFRAPSGAWTGVTGRVRVLAYNTDELAEDDVPTSVLELTDPAWSGRVGWAPTNGSFQAFVTAMRISEGEEATREWLEGMLVNDITVYENNTGIVEGIARGEIEVGLVNHYYVYRFLAEDPGFNVANAYLPGDIGGLVNVAGIGVLSSSDQQQASLELVRYLLDEETQTYFGEVTDAPEFPLRSGVDAPELPRLDELDPPQVDLSQLEDLQGTLALLHEVGALQ